MADLLDGYEIEEAVLAEGLRDLADGIESGSVPLQSVGSTHDVEAGDPSIFSLRIRYMTEDVELRPENFIEYSEGAEDGD